MAWQKEEIRTCRTDLKPLLVPENDIVQMRCSVCSRYILPAGQTKSKS